MATITATLPNGQTIKRTTKRVYTHALTIEIEYTDGTIGYAKAEWAGRPDLAQKVLARLQAYAAREIGTEVRRWTTAKGFENTGIYRKAMTAMAIPVNA